MEIFNKNNNISKKVSASLIAIVLILASMSVIILFVTPVRACHKVGTFESDYVAPKTTFLQGEIVYGKGTDIVKGYFKLRIRDKSFMFHSHASIDYILLKNYWDVEFIISFKS